MGLNKQTVSIGLEPLQEQDLKTVWLMRNDELVCRYAQSPKPVSWEEFEAVFKYTNYPKLVYKSNYTDNTNSSSIVIGYVDFRNDMIDDIDSVKEWSFFIAPDQRGKGWARNMLEEAIDWAKTKGYNKIRGIVKTKNEVSRKLHQCLNFQIEKEDNDETTYVLVLN